MPITAPIEVVGTDADDKKWVSLQDVKDELTITDASQDAILTKRIQRASSRLLKFTNLRGVAFRRYQETLPGLGETTDLLVTRVPIVNLLSVEISSAALILSGGSGTDITGEVLVKDPVAGILFRKFGWRWTALRGSFLGLQLTELGDQLPGTEEPTYAIDYEAGWVMPEQALPAPVGPNTPEEFPLDLQEAALYQVIYDHLKMGKDDDAAVTTSKRVLDTTIKKSPIGGKVDEEAMKWGLAPRAFHRANLYRRAA